MHARGKTERSILHSPVDEYGHLVLAASITGDQIQVPVAVQVTQSDQVGIVSRGIVDPPPEVDIVVVINVAKVK